MKTSNIIPHNISQAIMVS